MVQVGQMTKVYAVYQVDEEGCDDVIGIYSDLANCLTNDGWRDTSHWNYTRYDAEDEEGYPIYAYPFALDEVY